ncbi:MAG TPA: hypothetical protein VHP83_08705, partial [Aggregatilineaceae bacterium]|nr:hypothetical protein [Aggregatilineaceae bacterium]
VKEEVKLTNPLPIEMFLIHNVSKKSHKIEYTSQNNAVSHGKLNFLQFHYPAQELNSHNGFQFSLS